MAGRTDGGARRTLGRALAVYLLLPLPFTGHALLGSGSLGPDGVLDRDPLYRRAGRLPEPPFTISDTSPTVLDLPRDLAFAHGLHAGRVDLWNPLVAAGAPLWAEQGGPFFPLKLPFYLSPSRRTYDLFLTLRLVAAGLGAYLLARRRGRGELPALAAGALFELSGAMVSQLAFGATSATCVLPWILLGARGIAGGGGTGALVGTAAALGVAGHGGHPSFVLMVFLAYAAAAAGHAATAWRRPRAMALLVARFAAAGLLGLALAAVVLLPLADLLLLGQTYKDSYKGDFIREMYRRRFLFMLPIGLFAPGTLRTFWPILPRAYSYPWALGPVLGASGVTLAVAGVLLGGLDAALALVALLGVGLVVAPRGLGWLHDLPLVRAILPTYAWALIILPATQAAALALERIAAGEGRRRAALALGVLAVGPLGLKLVKNDFHAAANFGDALRQTLALRPALLAFVVPLAVAAVAWGAALLLGKTGRRARAAAVLLGILPLAELTWIYRGIPPGPVAQALDGPPSPALRRLLQTARGERITAVSFGIGHPQTPMLFGLSDLRQLSALPLRRYTRYLELAWPQPGYTFHFVDRAPSAFYDLAAVRFVLAPVPVVDPPSDATLPLVHRDSNLVIHENLAALPRVRVVREARLVTDEDAALRELSGWKGAKRATGTGLERVAILEPAAGGARPRPVSAAPGSDSAGIVDERDPDRVVIEANLAAPGYLLLADAYDPGWRATVDGVACPIHPANLLFRAVWVPAGAHRIVFSYRPRSVAVGGAAGLLAAAICAAALLVDRRRKFIAARDRS